MRGFFKHRLGWIGKAQIGMLVVIGITVALVAPV